MSFIRQGIRKEKIKKDKLVKKHTKGFYNTVGLMNEIATELQKLDIEITEDNVNEYASKLIGRDLDSMEKFLILGRIHVDNLDNEKDNSE